MLTKCPECELQISDKAITCPHCGYPLKEKISRPRTKKHMRLPNGFGQISEIKDRNLRNPWRVMVSVGKNSVGRPISKLLKPQAYFASYKEAYEALLEYNKNPYDLNDDLRLQELYERWSTEYFKTLKSQSSARTISSAWAYCTALYDMRVKDIRARHIKNIMEDGVAIFDGIEHHPTAGVKARIKSLFNLMLDYAVEYELTDRNYARTFEISGDILKEREDTKRSHLSFTDKEMEVLWQNIQTPYVDVILYQCYSGWRPQELCLLELKDVDWEKNIVRGGMKTEAGIDRIVPIHSGIKDIVKKYYDLNTARGSKYLFAEENRSLTYDMYRRRVKAVISNLGLNPDHRAHDPRKQFVTMAKKYHVDEYAIKRMIGHTVSDITESVYTSRDESWLNEEIEKIQCGISDLNRGPTAYKAGALTD